jgi:hypothetical protein
VGIRICRLFGLTAFLAPPDPAALGGSFVSYMFDHPFQLLLPLTAGGYLCAVLCWPVAYIMLYHPVRVTREAYVARRHTRQKEKNRAS